MAKPILAVGWDVGGWCGNKQAVAALRWDGGRADWLGKACCFTLADLPDDWGLNQLLRRAWKDGPEDALRHYQVVLAIDAPLGFPTEFSDLLAGRTPGPFAPDGREINNRLAYRETDRHVFTTFNKKPLSASFDKLGNNATVAMVHTRRLRQQNELRVPPFDEPDDSIATGIEVYPALVKQKRKRGDTEPLPCNASVNELLPPGSQPGSDECDACICALMALAYGHAGRIPGLPRIEPVPPPLTETIRREGWIYYPAARGPHQPGGQTVSPD